MTTDSTNITIDATPTWADVLPIFFHVLESQQAEPAGKIIAHQELGRLARWADAQMAKNRATPTLADIHAVLAGVTDSLAWHINQHGGVGMDQRRLADARAMLDQIKPATTQG